MSHLVPSKVFNFTDTDHHDTYGAINPSHANLSGKAVLITGASRGIGKATAFSFARAGASYIAITARSLKDLNEVEAGIHEAATSASKPSPKVLKVAVDVTSEESISNLALETEKAFGRLDILLNNAGVMEAWVPIAESDPETWWNTWVVNVRGPYLVTRAFLPLLLKTEGGEKIIVNLSSIGAHTKGHGGSSYQTGKLAILRFTEFTETEYGDKGVIAIAFHPGGVATDMGLQMPEQMHQVLVDTPQLAGDTLVWLTKERRPWLNGRYVSTTWDMPALEKMKDEILEGDKLRVKLVV